jgi:hypothetical protein
MVSVTIEDCGSVRQDVAVRATVINSSRLVIRVIAVLLDTSPRTGVIRPRPTSPTQ